MQCHTCERSNDAEAIFCAYCGVRMDSAPLPSGGEPITGATVDLRRTQAPAPSAPVHPAVVPPPGPVVTWEQHHPRPARRRQTQHQCAGLQGNWWGWLVLGIGALFLIKNMWGMLFIPALFGFLAWSSYNQHTRRGQHRQGKQSLVWLLGIGMLIATGWWIPGIFIVWIVAANIH